MILSLHGVQRAAALWIFPGLVLAMIAGNEGWAIGPLSLGQIVSWVNDGAAVTLVFGRFSGRWWPRFLLAATLGGKLLAIAGVAPAASDLAFDAGLCLLFCAAGAIVVSERPGIVYRQLLLIAALSIPVMIVQMTGLVPASEALNTEHTQDAERTSPVFFVPEADLHYRTAQARPSGLTHANNFLSLLAVFAVALHFSRIKTPWLTWRDVVVTVFALLTMAKVSLLVYGTVVLWRLVTGSTLERRRVARVAAFAAGFLAVYAIVFPGLFVANTAMYKITYSFFVRVNDFVNLLPDDSSLKVWLVERLAGTPKAEKEAIGLSGYAQIIGLLPYAIASAVLFVPIFIKGVRVARRRYPEAVDTTILMLFVLILFPAAVAMFRAQIFWFIAGFALLPAFIVWEPRRFRGPAGYFRLPQYRAEAGRLGP